MAISKKPTKIETEEAKITALIGKGGSHATGEAGSKKKPDDPVAVLIKIPAGMLEKVDSSINSRPVKISRRVWLLEAIHEKLCKEEG